MKHAFILLSFSLFTATSFAGDKDRKAVACGELKKEEVSRKMEKYQDELVKKARLSKEQKDQVKKLRAEHSELIFAQAQKVRGAHTDVVGAVENNAPNEVIRERVMNLENEKRALLSSKLDLMLATRDLLAPEQKQKAADGLREKLHEWCE